MNDTFDIVIIGAGIVGLSIANRLSEKYDNVLLIEKESSFGQHVSSRNSEVIHSGVYYPHKSLKASLCVRGNTLLYEFADLNNINYKSCGKFIVATHEKEIESLNKLMHNGIQNGLKGLKIISGKEVEKSEPLIQCHSALFVPSAGVIDSHGVMRRLEYLITKNGGLISYNTEVDSIQFKDGFYHIGYQSDDIVVKSKVVINSAGLWSDDIASMVGIENYQILYCKGDYYKLHTLRNKINKLIYPLPSNLSLGVHIGIHLDGTVSCGPNAYYVDDINYQINANYKNSFHQEISKYLDCSIDDMAEDFSGIRPKVQKKDEDFHDFIIHEETDNGYPGFINLIGIESPGLTSSLAIAEYVEKMII